MLQNVSRGAWNVVNQKLSAPARIRAWGAVVFDASPNFQQKVESFLAAVTNNMRRLGMSIDALCTDSFY